MIRNRNVTNALILKSLVTFLLRLISDGNVCKRIDLKKLFLAYRFRFLFTWIFSFNRLANELTLVIEVWLLITLDPSNSCAIISLLRNDGSGATDSLRLVRK